MKVLELTEIGQSRKQMVPVDKILRFAEYKDTTGGQLSTAIWLESGVLPLFCTETVAQIKAWIEGTIPGATMNSPAWRMTATRRGALRQAHHLLHDLAANGMASASEPAATMAWLAERADQERGEAYAAGILRYDTTQTPATEIWSN